MTKPFNHEHAANLAKVIKHKVPVQACFVSGFPGETKNDKKLNENYIKRLSKIGVDEILWYCKPVSRLKIGETISRNYRK